MSEALYPWQAAEIGRADTPKRAFFADPRTGKTIAAIRAAKAAATDRLLVIAPLVVCPQWAAVLREHGIEPYEAYKSTGSGARDKLRRADVVLLNYDKVPGLADHLVRWVDGRRTATIIDESHYIMAPQSLRGKACRRIGRRTAWLRLLTGTPSPNHYGNLWGQMTCIDPTAWYPNYTQFRERYLVWDPLYPSRILGTQPSRVPELREKLLRDACIVRRADVFGPDTYQVVERNVELPPRARALYATLVAEWIKEADDETGEVRVDHILKRMVRLQQIASGYVVDESGVATNVHDEKIDAVRADLDEIIASGEKAVVFHRYRWEGERYAAAIGALTPNVRRIFGETPASEREAVVRWFRESPESAIVVAQTQSAGIGISFAEATHALFVSQGFSFAEEEQARDRIYKPSASRCVTYYRAARTVDEYVASVIDAKQSLHDAVKHADIKDMAYATKRPRRRALV